VLLRRRRRVADEAGERVRRHVEDERAVGVGGASAVRLYETRCSSSGKRLPAGLGSPFHVTPAAASGSAASGSDEATTHPTAVASLGEADEARRIVCATLSSLTSTSPSAAPLPSPRPPLLPSAKVLGYARSLVELPCATVALTIVSPAARRHRAYE